MPGENCSVFGCPVCRCKEYRGISLFKVPAGKNDFDKNWRTRLVAVITEDRVVDASLWAQIERNNLYICQRHFTEDQYYRHETKVTLNPGVIPSLNLPQKSHPSSSTITKPRNSAEVIQQKKDTFLSNKNSSKFSVLQII